LKGIEGLLTQLVQLQQAPEPEAEAPMDPAAGPEEPPAQNEPVAVPPARPQARPTQARRLAPVV